MRVSSLTRWIPGAVLGAVLLAGCSTDAGATSGSPTPSPTGASASASSEFAIGDYLDPMTVTLAEPGPRPLLSWQPVAGATGYLVTVLDASGVGYWAWSGTATEVHVGGTSEPDAIGPYVYEDMTWMVAAEDETGALLAVSEPSPLTP